MAEQEHVAPDNATPPPVKRYPLGVLFVHGIGEQPMGETLKNVVDPLVRSLDLWVHGAGRCRALSLGETGTRQWAANLPAGTLSAEQIAALGEQMNETIASVDWPAEQAKPDPAPAVSPATPWGGSAVLRDGEPPSSDAYGSAPTHAVLHLQTLDGSYAVTEARALLAECWWARSFVPPSSWALLAWTFKVLPLAFAMHMADVLHRHAGKVGDGSLPWYRRAWHVVMTTLCTLLLTPAVMAALPVQVLLTASVVLSLVPIRLVQDAMRSLQSVLIGTLGDSFLLVSSPVSRAMIVAQCKRDLQWLADQCEKVILVAHSQGCAVSYLALCEQRPDELTEVAWVGSGLRKLEALRTAERNPFDLSAAWLVAAMPLPVWFLGHDLIAHARWDGVVERSIVFLLFVLFFLLGFLRMVTPLRIGATALWLRSWQSLNLRFWDVHASHDPVPHGALSNDVLPPNSLLVRQEVRNLASRIGDHVSYWRNMEEVMLPLGLRVARAMGVPLDLAVPGDDKRCAAGVQRRHHRVNWLVALRLVMWVGAIALIVGGWEQWKSLGHVALAQGLSWDGFSDFDLKPFAPALRALLPEVLLWWVVPYAAMVVVWNGWEAHEQRAFLMRDQPDTWIEWLIVFALVLAVLTPIGRAAMHVVPKGAGPIVLLYVLLACVFAAVFYVFSLKSPKQAFKRSP